MIAYVIFLCSVGFIFGCEPVDSHYQSSYCDADIAAVVKVVGNETYNETIGYNIYHGTVLEDIKDSMLQNGSRVTLWGEGPFQSCGETRLDTGEIYMILGTKEGNAVIIEMFNGDWKMSNLAAIEEMRLRISAYDCRCEIPARYYWDDMYSSISPLPDNQCSNQGVYGCRWENGACVYRNGKCEYIDNCSWIN